MAAEKFSSPNQYFLPSLFSCDALEGVANSIRKSVPRSKKRGYHQKGSILKKVALLFN